MSSNLISIVLTLYNKAPYIEETIFSIYKQTYKNWELIIVDDCSTDWSFEIAKSFCEKLWIEKKCKFIQNEKNLRVAKTFEKWLKESKWNRITICDADDILMNNKLEKNLKFCKEKNFRFCHSDLIVIDEFNHVKSLSWIKMKNFIRNKKFTDIIQHNCITWSSVFFHKKKKKHMLNAWLPDKIYQDWCCATYASLLNVKIWFIDEPLVFYRRCDSCITADKWTNSNKDIFNNYKIGINREILLCKYIYEHFLKLDDPKKKWIRENIKANESLLRHLESKSRFPSIKTYYNIIHKKLRDSHFLYVATVSCIRKIFVPKNFFRKQF